MMLLCDINCAHAKLEDTDNERMSGNKTLICGSEYSVITVFYCYYTHGRIDQHPIKNTE